MGLNIKDLVEKELTEIQKRNEAERFEEFKNETIELIMIYKANNGNFSNKKQTLKEFISNYIPQKIIKRLTEEGLFDE